MIDLRYRATEPELLDGDVSAEETRRSLADLRLVNRWLSNSSHLIETVLALLDGAAKPRLLDVGCASADLLQLIARRASGSLTAVGVDIKHRHLELAPASVRAVVSDVRGPPFREESFDVVAASHFLHHFDAAELPGILAALFRLARRALVINDLERARVPYLFGRVAFPLLFTSRVSVLDGLVSIRRGFQVSELDAAFREAGIPARIERSWPYRLIAVAERGSSGT